MYKVLITKNESHETESYVGFNRKHFVLYFETSDEVCALIQHLDEWMLCYSLEYLEFSKFDVIDDIKKALDLK